MTIEFTCPHCGTQTDVFDQYAGQTGPCAVCGRMITVPLAAPSGAGTAPTGTAPSSTTRARRWGSSLLIAGGTLAGVLAGLAAVVWMLAAIVFPILTVSRQKAFRADSVKQLKTIVTALRSYELDYGCLPPAVTADDKGLPMHSWRVLLLPYLGYDHVYDRYDLHQPWDSPQNMLVLSMMPAEYASPADPDAAARFETNYMVITGRRTAFPGTGTTSLSEMTDEPAQTILVAETPACGVAWMQPVDLNAEAMRFVVNGREGVEIGSRIPGGASVGLASGDVELLADETPPEYVQAMTTISGNETVPWFAVE